MTLKLSASQDLPRGRIRVTAERGIWAAKNCWSSCLLCSNCFIVSLAAGQKVLL
ncbi:hypothetical protein Gorai_013220 [Gossypium raimondii]|uniref:Uncharacterized protein n=1 Tax=Gossypium raimondii TaxID=29730 RepID=A0A7J8Q4D0_GOSRA|nr:hypothetical protein [Gossypium raimondii]